MRYVCEGYWKDTGKRFEGYIIDDESWDGNEADDDVFYYTDGEPVMGEHFDFVVTDCVEE